MTTSYASVKTQHKEYNANIERWNKVRNVLSGNVKQYLRDVSSSEPDKPYATQRQKDYEDGAVYYNFVKRTLSGMVGAVMRKPPEEKLPPKLQYLLSNADGSGLGIVEQSQDALREVDSIGRAGLLVDAPQVAAANRADQNAGKLDPRIQLYTAENIISWRKTSYGSTSILSLVILREIYEYQDGTNEFAWLEGERYRVLELVEGKYQQRVFEFDSKGVDTTKDIDPIVPKTSGKPFDYIPFFFIGADNNDEQIDSPPLEALADVSIGHFRNSADVEDSSFICGQPTMMMYPGESMSVEALARANKNGIRLGCRTAHNLGFGGRAELLQASPSSLPKELMKDKENQAVMIGAQLITPTAQITAESARMQRGADTSIMATIALNVSSAYEQAINACAQMLNATGEIVFQLNMEFFLNPMTAQDRAAWMMDLNAGLLPRTAYYSALRAAGATDWTDEEIDTALQTQAPAPAPALNTDVEGEIPESPTPEDKAAQ